METKSLARLSWWKESQDRNKGFYSTQGNLRAANFGKPLPNPEALLSEEAAKEVLREYVSKCTVIVSQFSGECSLTDTQIRKGEEIYFLQEPNGGIKLTISKTVVDEILS